MFIFTLKVVEKSFMDSHEVNQNINKRRFGEAGCLDMNILGCSSWIHKNEVMQWKSLVTCDWVEGCDLRVALIMK